MENDFWLKRIEAQTANITPDPKCKVAGCYGKKGYSGMAITFDEKGNREVRLNFCCGKIGKTEYARIQENLVEVYKMQTALDERITKVTDGIVASLSQLEGRTLHGTVRQLARKVVSWFAKRRV